MELSQLRNFIAVVENGSFSKAAKINYLSQRAISLSISQLEKDLQFKLVLRGKNRISFTEEGLAFYTKAKDIIQDLETTTLALRNKQTNTKREFSIGYFSPFDETLLVKHIEAADFKDTKLFFSEKGMENLISNVMTGALDCAYVIDYNDAQPYMNNINLESKVIYRNTLLLGISKKNPLSKRSALPIDVLTKYPILYYAPEESPYIRDSFASKMPVPYYSMNISRIASIEHLQLLVATNQAISHYGKGMINLPLDDQISYLPLENTDTTYSIRLIWNKNSKNLDLINIYMRAIDAVGRNFGNPN